MKLILSSVDDSLKQKVGHFILLFSQVEWFIGNVIFYSHVSVEDFKQIEGNHPMAIRYLHTLFQMDFYKKTELLKKEGYDVLTLIKIQKYRAILAHGLIFYKDGIIKVSKPHKDHNEIIMSENELNNNISLLEEEGGKLHKFLLVRGFDFKNSKISYEKLQSKRCRYVHF